MRGQSAAVAVVILIGIVAMSTIAILLVAGNTVDEMEQQSKLERVEGSFVELSHELRTASQSSDSAQTVELGLGDESDQVEMRDEGRIVVSVGNETLVNETMGTIVYEADDGTIVAYQGGAVWRGTGAAVRMISAPQIHYADGGLTFSIPKVSGEDTLHSGSVTLSTQSIANRSTQRIDDRQVRIEITSQCYAGWARYFDQSVDNATVVHDGSGNETVVVTFGEDTGTAAVAGDPAPVSVYDVALYAEGDMDLSDNTFVAGDVAASGTITTSGNPVVTGNQTDGLDAELSPHDDTIQTLVDGADPGDWQSLSTFVTLHCQNVGSWTCDSGTYYIDDFDPGLVTDDIAARNGDIVLVVDDDVEFHSDSINITAEDDHAVRTYTTGNVTMRGDSQFVAYDENDRRNPTANQIYATSSSEIDLGESGTNSQLFGVLSAPPGTATKQETSIGNLHVVGAIHAGEISFSGNPDIYYHPSLENFDYPGHVDDFGAPGPEQSIYLNVVVHDVDVTDE